MDELRIKIEQLIEDLENETANRNMNDLEEGRYKALCEVLDLIDEQKKWGVQWVELIKRKITCSQYGIIWI